MVLPISNESLEIGIIRATNMINSSTTTNQLNTAMRYIRLLIHHSTHHYFTQLNTILETAYERAVYMRAAL